MKTTALAIAATAAVMLTVHLVVGAMLPPETPSEATEAAVKAPEGFNGFEVQQTPPAPPRFVARDQNGEMITVDQAGNYQYTD